MVVSEGAINNIMGGMENTAGVRLHSHRHKLKQRFDIVRKLGQGTYGKVQLALNKETGQEVAIKTIKKAKIETEQDLVRIRREIQIMSSVQHPQIIHIYEVFENREKMVLVMEYAAGGELYDYLSERKVLAEEEARRIFRQVASAVYYCHKHKICHRDLKLENILLDLDGNAKIADFGLSNVFDEKQRLDTFCGSPLYASPEIVKGVPYIGPEVDCWSLGVLLYTLVYGAMPFDGSNFRRLVKQITQGDFYEPSTPATASELIRHMLTVQSTERATVEDICNHWWVNEGYSESCFTQAEALANQTPVRLDLLLSLAPKHISSEHMLIQPDDEDISQKSDSDRAPPNLKIPPPPTLPEGELDAEPLPIRSHSLGAVPPPGGVSVDLLIEKKKKEKEKKKKESSSKKPPSRPPVEEEKKTKKKEEKPEPEEKRRSVKREASVEGDKENSKKRETSTDRERAKKRDISTDIEKERAKKRDISGDRVKIKKREGSIEVDKDIPKENQIKEVEKKIVKKRESSLTRKSSTKKKDEDAPSATLTTSSIDVQKLPEAPAPSKVDSKSEVKEVAKPSSRKSITKSPEKKIVAKKLEDSLHNKDEDKETDKILKETAAKIEKAESLIKKEEEIITPVSSPIISPVSSPMTSPVISPPVTSPVVSTHSSVATSPVRSRTGSESSTEAPRTKSESNSRRQSKIFSKAALFDPALSPQQSISPSPQDKVKKITRPGALNLSDLTKKFEEKPTIEKKNKVVTPFKVSDARKAFESKSDKSVTEIPKRRTSVDSNGESGSASPKDALPASPTKGDKTIANSISKLSPSNKSTNKINRETSPVKKISKSPPKETGRISPVKREKSPRKEASPTKVIHKTVTKVSSFSKAKDEIKDKKSELKAEVAKKEPETPVANKVGEREIPIKQRGDTSDSSDSESEAEKMLKELSEKREKLEMAKKEKMKKVSEEKEAQSARDMPAIREEAKNTTPVLAASGALSPQDKDQKFATLPRGFKSKIEPTRTQAPKPLPKISSIEESYNGEPVRKRTQVGIVLQNRQPANHYEGKRGSFSEVGSSSPRPEYRTEVQHTVGTPELRAAPEPQLQRARRERIIPIMLEDDMAGESDVRGTSSRSSVIQPSSSSSSRTSSVSSVPRNSGFGGSPISATVASSASSDRQKFNQPSPESLKKSRRERIIPIAVEGEGFMTPPIAESRSTEKVRPFHRQGSSQGSFNRGRGFTLDRNESFSSAGEDDDEEDDGFQILTAESLFSTLLSRVRSLTRKMGGEDGATGVGGMRRGPQPGVNSDTPSSAGSSGTQSGFWSSLYSPPRDLPGRTIPLSREHSQEQDPFVSFGPPLWDRSLSRNTSDSDSVFSEPSGPFSTLPRGWRARRPVREESIIEGDEELSSFTPSRRHFYSRTLSRDLPLKTGGDGSKRTGNRNSWDPSTSTGTIPRPSATPGSTLPTQYHQESINRITPQRQNLNTTRNSSLGALNNVGSRESPFSSLLNSGEASGRVGGHFEQQKNTSNAQLASPVSNKDKEETRETQQSVQQLKELVNELESVPDDTHEISGKGRAKSAIKMLSTGNQVSLQSPKPSKSFTSFQTQHPITNQSGSNPNIVFNITISAPKHQLTSTPSTDPTSSQVKTSAKNLVTSKEPLDTNAQTTNKLYNKISSDTLTGTGPKNTFIPYNRTLSNLSQKNLNTNALKSENPTNDKIQDISPPLTINNTEKLNGFVKIIENPNDTLKPISNVSLTPKLSDINNKSSSVLEHKKYLTAEPYRRGRSEDLRSTIDIVNSSPFLKDLPRGSIKPYARSKSRDITPTIEAASEKFTQLNSGTLKKISPFEAYRRSKSKELGSAIDLVNNVNEFRMKSPPTEILPRSDSSTRQFEKVKTSFEKKFEKAKSPPLELEKSKSPPIEFAKTKSPSFVGEVIPKVVENSINSSKEHKVNFVADSQKEKEKQAKDSDKSKSVYKIITSKFSRSLSNLGEDRQETKQPKDNEEENNEKEDKFKLKRPSIFMKSKMEKSSSKTSLSEVDGKDEEVDKNERKTNKFSYALNKFLGRKVDENSSKINKPDSLNLPKKSTSTAIMSDKLKKPPRFRTKKFSKSHENLNRGEDDLDEYDHGTRAKSVMPETVNSDDRTLESATKGICNHLSQIEINITSQIDNISPTKEIKPITTNPSASTHLVSSISSYGLSPALATKRNNISQQNSNDNSPGSPTELDSISKKKLSGEFSEDGSVTPTTESGNESALSGLEDIKEVEDESVMDRITRKSYYSRFNEMKRKPKLRRIDSKESMDQQLAAAKARLMQEDEGNLQNGKDTSNSLRTTPQRLLSISPPPVNEGITRRTLKGNVMPRTISLPPEDGLGLYTGIRSRQDENGRLSRQPSTDPSESTGYYRSPSASRDEAIPYRRQLSGNLDESNYKRLSSIGRDDPPFYLRQPSVSREEQPAFRLPSVVRDETPTYRRLSAAMRDEPQLRRSSVTKDEPSTYQRFSTTNKINDKRLSSIPREDTSTRRLSMNRDENSGYHTLQYRKTMQIDDPKTKRYSSSYSSKDLALKQNEINEKYNSSSPTSPSISPTISFPQKIPENTDTTGGENYDKSEVFAAVNAAGKAAGEAAAAALSSEDQTQRIPSPLSPYAVSDPAAVKTAREELSRRLTPLTRLSTLGGGDPIARPYRRTVTSGSLPLGQSNANKPLTIERPYRRTATMDLPPMDSRPRIIETRRVLQEPSRRYSGFSNKDWRYSSQ